MSRAKAVGERFLPWGGLIGGGLGAGLAHQIGSDSVFNDCAGTGTGGVLLAGAAGLVLLALGALASWKVWSRREEEPPRRLIATVSLMASGLLLFAILLPMIASLLIPPCFG